MRFPHIGCYWLLFLLMTTSICAQEIRPTPRDGEFVLGPFRQPQIVEGVEVQVSAWIFVDIRLTEDQLQLRARVVGDLSGLQDQIGALIGKFPLPSDRCARLVRNIRDLSPERLNFVLRIEGTDLTSQKDTATLRLQGKLAGWHCARPFGIEVLNTTFPSTRFTAAIPFALEAIADGSAILFSPQRPDVDLGKHTAIIDGILKIGGFDMTREVQKLLEDAIQPVGFKNFLAEDFQDLEPRFTAARFFDAGGNRLAAEVEMQVILDREALRNGEIRAAGN